jgi:hypothetical protein
MTMGMTSVILHRYMAPFAAGMSMAAATAAGGSIGTALLLGLAGCFAYASLPAGGRMISRMVDAPA